MMDGIAYGARSASRGQFGELPMLDVCTLGKKHFNRCMEHVAVVAEEPYAGEIAEQIAEASSWDELPSVEFEDYQVVGHGR